MPNRLESHAFPALSSGPQAITLLVGAIDKAELSAADLRYQRRGARKPRGACAGIRQITIDKGRKPRSIRE
jgi:hypothetical protein